MLSMWECEYGGMLFVCSTSAGEGVDARVIF